MGAVKLSEYSFFLEAFLLLHISKLIIWLVPFRLIVKKLGIANLQSPIVNKREREVEEITKAIFRAAKRTLVKNNCYNRALTAKMMLARRNISYTFFLGVSKSDEGLKAHAWIRSGNVVLTGESEMVHFTPVSFFSRSYEIS